MKKFIYAFLLLSLSQNVMAKNLHVAVFYSQYLNISGQPYIETYFSLDPHSVLFTQNENKTWQGGIEILITLSQNGEIKAFDKLMLRSSEMVDTTIRIPYTTQQSRVKLDAGDYMMKIELVDEQTPNSPVILEREIQINLTRTELRTSSILLLDSYRESEAGSVVGKWGYDLVPIVPMGTYYIDDALTNLPFYCEVFNSDVAFGENEAFMLKYYLKDNLSKQVLQRFAGFQRATGNVVTPVLNTFNIKNLPSGYYDLVLEVVNKNNEVVATESVSFYRRNANADMQNYDFTSAQITSTFVESLTNVDSLSYYIDCLYPISTESERRISQLVLTERDIPKMQRYFLTFWNKRNPIDPSKNWREYMVMVNYAEKQFGSTSVRGYRTDMGRVLLQYGTPTTIERVDHDPSNYPFQIWQYDLLLSATTPQQNNQMFVFVDQMLVGRNYTLIHATGINEIKDHKWEYSLNRNTNRGYDVDATSTQKGRDNFGYRTNNNFIIGDTRYWGDR